LRLQFRVQFECPAGVAPERFDRLQRNATGGSAADTLPSL